LPVVGVGVGIDQPV